MIYGVSQSPKECKVLSEFKKWSPLQPSKDCKCSNSITKEANTIVSKAVDGVISDTNKDNKRSINLVEAKDFNSYVENRPAQF